MRRIITTKTVTVKFRICYKKVNSQKRLVAAFGMLQWLNQHNLSFQFHCTLRIFDKHYEKDIKKISAALLINHNIRWTFVDSCDWHVTKLGLTLQLGKDILNRTTTEEFKFRQFNTQDLVTPLNEVIQENII